MTNVASIRDVPAPAEAPVPAGVPLVPIVMILGQGADIDGQLRELARRIEGLLSQSASDPAPVFEAGELRIDRRAHRVTVAGEAVRLTGLEYRLLCKLVERHDTVQPR